MTVNRHVIIFEKDCINSGYDRLTVVEETPVSCTLREKEGDKFHFEICNFCDPVYRKMERVLK